MMILDGIDYPLEHVSEYIKRIRDVKDDLFALLDTSGEKIKYGILSKKRYEHLEIARQECVFHREWFESYGNYREITFYGIRFNKTKHNLRIIFIFWNDKVVLLHAFAERKSSDVTRALETAYRRYNKETKL